MAGTQVVGTPAGLAPMVLRDVDGGGFVWANQAFAELLGWSKEELRASPLTEFVEFPDRAVLEATLKAGHGVIRVHHMATAGKAAAFDIEIRTEDGVQVALGTLAEPNVSLPERAPPKCPSAVTGAHEKGKQFSRTLRTMANIVEDHNPGLRCSILLLSEDGARVTVGAGPSLPAAYNAAVEGLQIGPFVGSCGTAAYWNHSVVVADIQGEALWRDLRVEAAAAGVAACWSRPIRSETGHVLGALALYSPVPALPSTTQLNGLGMAAKMVALAIDRGRAAELLRTSQAALRQSEDRYRALYEDNPSMYFTVDAGGRILSVNEYGASCLGYSPEDLVGQAVSGLFHPDDREDLERRFRVAFEQSGDASHWEMRKIHRDGRVLWVRETLRVVQQADGEPVALVVCEDTTDRWHASQLVEMQSSVLASIAKGDALTRSLDLLCRRIEGLVPGARCLVLLLDTSGTRLRSAAGPSMSPSLLGALDGLSAEQALGTCGAAVFLGHQVIVEDVEDAPAWTATRRLAQRHDVRASWSTPLQSGSGDVLGAISICHPIPQSPTEPDQRLMETAAHLAAIATERQLKEEGLRMRQKLESLGLMAGGVAHDFNNLLVPMMGQSTIALGKLSADDPARAHVEQAFDAAKKAAELTSQLLAYTGRGHFDVQPLCIDAAIGETLHLFDAVVDPNVRIQHVATAEETVVLADRGQIQQVLMNLVINAAESMKGDSGAVVIRTRRATLPTGAPEYCQYGHEPLEGGEYVILEVEDDGPGMEAATISRVFDPFFTTKSAGRGLGLAAVTGIVRGHNGGVRVKSLLGRGTTFSLAFPASTSVRSTEEQTAVKPPTAEPVARVLVIDDEEAVLDSAADFLEHAGMTVLKAASGAVGVELYRQQRADIDLVLLDLSMPRMSGEETLRHLREIDPEARILLTSGYNEADVARRFVGRPFAGFIKKPYQPDTLARTVLGLLT